MQELPDWGVKVTWEPSSWVMVIAFGAGLTAVTSVEAAVISRRRE